METQPRKLHGKKQILHCNIYFLQCKICLNPLVYEGVFAKYVCFQGHRRGGGLQINEILHCEIYFLQCKIALQHLFFALQSCVSCIANSGFLAMQNLRPGATKFGQQGEGRATNACLGGWGGPRRPTIPCLCRDLRGSGSVRVCYGEVRFEDLGVAGLFGLGFGFNDFGGISIPPSSNPPCTGR